MIQREWLPCSVYRLSNYVDEYGQRRTAYTDIVQEEIVIKPYREKTANDPRYLETEWIGLIKGQYGPNDIIKIGETYYRILDTIWSVKFQQVFLKETTERPTLYTGG